MESHSFVRPFIGHSEPLVWNCHGLGWWLLSQPIHMLTLYSPSPSIALFLSFLEKVFPRISFLRVPVALYELAAVVDWSDDIPPHWRVIQSVDAQAQSSYK